MIDPKHTDADFEALERIAQGFRDMGAALSDAANGADPPIVRDAFALAKLACVSPPPGADPELARRLREHFGVGLGPTSDE
jgi:hypothetical protein